VETKVTVQWCRLAKPIACSIIRAARSSYTVTQLKQVQQSHRIDEQAKSQNNNAHGKKCTGSSDNEFVVSQMTSHI
jgi:hypothetical protein